MANYRYDENLEFLGKCTNEELELLFSILVYDSKDGKKRYSEELTNTKEYKRYREKYIEYWEEIAGELQHYGGNTIVNKLRGTGVLYDEILNDVMEKLDIGKFGATEQKENRLLEYMFEQMIEKMSLEEKAKLAKELGLERLDLSKGAMLIGVQGLLKIGGTGLTNLIGLILKMVGVKVIPGRIFGVLTGPIGLGISGIWTLIDITSPAMRVTIPGVVVISCLRKIVEEREKNKK